MSGTSKQCKRCGRMMKRLTDTLYHCKCGSSWVAGVGYTQLGAGMQEKEWKDQVQASPAQVNSKNTSRNFHTSEKSGVVPTSAYRGRKLIRGGIYYVYPHPTYGHEVYSGRPGVVLSSVTAGKYRSTVSVAYLTSKKKTPSKTRTVINGTDRQATILVDQVDTVDVDLVGDYMGICSPEEMTDIKRCLAAHFGFAGVENYDDKDTAEYIAQLEYQISALSEQLREREN